MYKKSKISSYNPENMICKQDSLFLQMNYQQKTIFIPFKIHDGLIKNTGCHRTIKKDFHARIICKEPRRIFYIRLSLWMRRENSFEKNRYFF